MKKSILIIFILLLCYQSKPQLIKYPIENYTQKDYGRGQEAQNWSVVQDKRGLMYFGNANGILEFDGRTWRFIPVKTGTYVTSLACDSDGRIYAGAQNDFGLLEYDNNGKQVFRSLADSVDKHNFSFSTVWKTIVIDKKVFFQSEEFLFIYENSGLSKIPAKTSFHLSFKVNNEFWIRQRNIGLMKYESGSLKMLRNGEFFKEIGISGITAYKGNASEFLITTFDQGFYIYNAVNGEINQFHPSSEPAFLTANLYGAILLHDGSTAINSTNRGLFIMNVEGKISGMVNEESGLQVNDIKQVFQDRNLNIWLALNNGIACINYTSPLSFYNQKSGISGNVYSVGMYKGQLFTGTSTGLYKQLSDKPFYSFERVLGISNQVWAMADMADYLIIAASDALYTYKNGTVNLVTKLNCRSMYADRKNNLLYVGGNHGIAIFELKKQPVLFGYIEDVLSDVVAISKSEEYSEFSELWLGTAYQGVIRLRLSKNLEVVDMESFNEQDGLPAGYVLPFEFNKQITFATVNGLYNFLDAEEVKKMLPDSLKKNNEKIKGFFEPSDAVSKFDNRAVTCLLFNANYRFIVYNNLLHHATGDSLNSQPFSGIEYGKINSLLIYNNFLWIGADDGLIAYQLNNKANYNQSWKVLIRKISIDDSVAFSGSDKLGLKLVFPFGNNRITFEFTGLFYDHSDKITYSYLLEGFDKNWSTWNTGNSITFTSLREGKYTLRVKARNIYGVESSTESISFEILPPWYRSRLAYAVYVILFGLFIWLLVVLSRLGLKRKNDYLESVVAKRTVEIRNEKEKSEKLLLNTLPAKVVDDLKMYGKTEPESFREVTAYFSDVCGFTDMSTTLDPKFLISELNDIFTAFDDIMIRNQCERIKTIGDAYLAVCGMPEPNEKHAENIINAAVEIIKYLEERNKTHELKWRIRIGINSGKVVGGIVGVRKYIYDVFGDTINTASRMESNSEPMRINVAENSYQILKDKYRFFEREPVNVKGKGVMKMYFLETENL